MDGFFGYMWRMISQVLEEGETWVVLSLVGMYSGSDPGRSRTVRKRLTTQVSGLG